jgi:hypothetical protein
MCLEEIGSSPLLRLDKAAAMRWIASFGLPIYYLLLEKVIVLTMVANPKPDWPLGPITCQSAIMGADMRRREACDLLQPQRRMVQIACSSMRAIAAHEPQGRTTRTRLMNGRHGFDGAGNRGRSGHAQGV